MDSEELSEKLGLLDRHVERQSDLADVTRLVGERLQERGNDNVEAMFQAEASMIQAADSLTLADFEAALPQQEDAQRFLVEARTEIERVLGQGNRRSMSGNPRQNMLQTVRQRLRRRGNRGEQEQQTQRDLVARLRGLAAGQLGIARELEADSEAPSGSSPVTPASPAAPASPVTPASPAADDPTGDSPASENPQPTDDAENDAATPTDDETEEQTRETLGERQTALLDEAAELDETIDEMSWPTSQIPERMDQVVQQIDEVTSVVRDQEPQSAEVETDVQANRRQPAGTRLEH